MYAGTRKEDEANWPPPSRTPSQEACTVAIDGENVPHLPVRLWEREDGMGTLVQRLTDWLYWDRLSHLHRHNIWFG